MAQEKIMNLAAQQYYDEKIKAYIKNADEKVLSDAKAYADDLADNYDAAGTAQTKVNELANGQVKTNTEAIAKLNGDASTEGSVDKKITDAKAELTETIESVEDKADAAQEDVDALEADMGDVDGLSTTNKTIVGAINEVLTAVGTGGTAAVVTVTTDTTSEGALKSYTIKQGENTVGVIDIPKDMVVESGSVVTNPEGQAEGTYIKLVLANVAEPLFINVGTLVDIYKAKANATQIQVAIDSSTREISATIVAGSVTATELADNSVITAKIADGNVTKAKLSSAVQSSLDKADAAAPQTSLDDEISRAKEAEAKALTDAKAYTDEKVAAEKERAEGIESGLEERLAVVEAELGDGEGTVTAQIATAKQEAIDTAAGDATTKANTAESNAKAHADELNTAMNTRVEALEAIDHDHANKEELDKIASGDKAKWDAASDIAHEHENADVLDGITAEKVSAWDSAETNAKGHADDLNEAMDERVQALESKVGDGFVAVTNAEIDAMFA